MRIICVLISGLLLFMHKPAASELDSLVLNFDTVEVVSFKIPLKLYETGRDLYVIDAENIQNSSARSVDEVLRFIPGLEVQSRGPAGVQSDFSLRGSTFSQVLVLIDGVRWNDPLTGHFNSNIPIPLKEIDRIEVLKGPSSALYGSDAMGGVINIITRTQTASYEDSWSLNGSVTGGEYGLFSGNVHFHLKPTEKTTVSMAAGSHNASGHPDIDDDPYWFNLHHATLGVNHQFSDRWNAFYRVGYDYRDFSAKYFYTASPFDEAEELTKAFWNHLRISQNNTRSRTEIDVYHKRNSDRFVFNPNFPPTNNHITTLSGVQLNNWWALSSRSDLNLGVRGNLRDIESNDRGNHSDYTVALYGGYRYQLSNRSHLNLGLSIDRDKNFGWEANPQLSYALTMGKVTLRASAGQSIRAADYTERYISTSLPGPLTTGRNLGNPNLQAERATQVDLGASIELSPTVNLQSGLFYRNGKNIIDYVLTDASEIPNNSNLEPDGTYLYTQNIAGVETKGFEVRILFRNLHCGSTIIRGEASYTFNDITTDQPVNAKYITGQARHLANSTLHFSNGPWHLSLSAMYKNRNTDFATDLDADLSSSYTVINGKVNRKLMDNNLGLHLEVHNITDTEYSDILAVRMPGRWLSGGISWSLN